MHDAFKSSPDLLHYYETTYLLNAFKPHERVTGKRSGTPRALWTFCQNTSVGKLLEVKDFKHLSIKPELAGSFNVRLDLRGGVMGVLGHCVGDAVPMRSHAPDAIHHNSSSPSQLCACYSVFQSVKRLCLHWRQRHVGSFLLICVC